MKNNPSTIKNAKRVQSYEVPIWEGQTKLLTDLTIKVKHGGYLHSDQAKGSRREKSEIHQCWAGRNKNVIFIVKIIKKPNKQDKMIKLGVNIPENYGSKWKMVGEGRNREIYPSIVECSLPDVGMRRAKLKHQLSSLLPACACRNWE